MSKSRFWGAIFYFDDFYNYENLKSILINTKVPFILSPLHDKDIFFEGENKGEIKKSHYHCVFQLPYPKDSKSSLTYLNALLPHNHQLSYLEQIGKLNLYCRYLAHLDNPEKARYNINECLIFADFPADFELEQPKKSKRSCRREIINFITSGNNQPITFLQLVNFYIDDDEIMTYIEKNSYFISMLLKNKL